MAASLDTTRIKVTNRADAIRRNALNAVGVRNMEAAAGADGNGLYLRVDPSGSRRWMLRTIIAGRRCDLGLGSAYSCFACRGARGGYAVVKIARGGR